MRRSWFNESCAKEADAMFKVLIDNDAKLRGALYACAYDKHQKRAIDAIVNGSRWRHTCKERSILSRVDRVLAGKGLHLIYLGKTNCLKRPCVADTNTLRKATYEYVKSLAEYSYADGSTSLEPINTIDLSNADLSSCKLNHFEFIYVDLSGADLRNTDLTDVRFDGVDFRNVKINGPELVGARFSDVLTDKYTASLLMTFAGDVKDLRIESDPEQPPVFDCKRQKTVLTNRKCIKRRHGTATINVYSIHSLWYNVCRIR